MTVAFFDVDYRTFGAKAACVLAESWTAPPPSTTYTIDIASVEEYEAGQFYRRELPCLLELLNVIPTPPDVLVVDGYVWLANESRPGLGAHLHQALDARVPVVGVAKRAFNGADGSPAVIRVLRGRSTRPLYVTAAGVDPSVAAAWVAGMAGMSRIPDLLAAVDRLSRST